MKTCFKCGQSKDLDCFYKHPETADGRIGKCKDCTKEDVRNNRIKKRDYYLEYDRYRYQHDPKVRERLDRYQKTANGKKATKAAKARWEMKNPIKKGASTIVGNAIRDKRLVKPESCSQCGKGGRIHGHHDDYAYPLAVRWLCAKCHTAWHKENGEGLNA